MTQPAHMIEYASDSLEQPADRLLRYVIACAAIVYGGGALLRTALVVALAKGWAASPSTMSWGLDDGWRGFLSLAQALTMAGLVLGGVLLLRRSRASVPVLRVCVVCAIVLAIVILVGALRASAVGASYWSTPATATIRALEFLGGLWVLVVIGVLMLPPLARRMV